MDAKVLISQLADSARIAGRTLSVSTGAQRKAALNVIADAIEARSAEILAANEKDMEAGRAAGLNSSLLDRLLLTPDRITGIAGGARQVSQLPDPLGNTLRKSTLPNGIELEQISVPFGVIGMVYEARPNVTVDAAVILLMSGNAALLRGSSSAAHSNEILVRVMREALASTSISPDVIQLVPSEDRETVKALLNARGKVDLVIPCFGISLAVLGVKTGQLNEPSVGSSVKCKVFARWIAPDIRVLLANQEWNSRCIEAFIHSQNFRWLLITGQQHTFIARVSRRSVAHHHEES